MFNKTNKKIKGYLLVEAKGYSLERYMNILTYNNICLWNTQANNLGILKFNIYAKDYKKALTLARKCRIRLKILSRTGYPFLYNKYKKRFVFIWGIGIFTAIIVYLSSFIWLIEVKGNSYITTTEITKVLNEKGLIEGRFKYTLNTKKLTEDLRQSIPQISWASIKCNGTRVTVEIKEEMMKDSINLDNTPCSIVSTENALVREIIAKSGKPLVKPTDFVTKGQVLISGDITYNVDGEDKVFDRVKAEGIIKGDVKRSFTHTIPYKVKLKQYTGNTEYKYNFKFFNRNFNTNFLKNDVTFEKYDIIEETQQIGLGKKFMMPFFVQTLVFKEYAINDTTITEEKAKDICKKEINRKILLHYSKECDIIDTSLVFYKDKDGIRAIATVTATEPIGKVEILTNLDQGGIAFNGTTENTD